MRRLLGYTPPYQTRPGPVEPNITRVPRGTIRRGERVGGLGWRMPQEAPNRVDSCEHPLETAARTEPVDGISDSALKALNDVQDKIGEGIMLLTAVYKSDEDALKNLDLPNLVTQERL